VEVFCVEFVGTTSKIWNDYYWNGVMFVKMMKNYYLISATLDCTFFCIPCFIYARNSVIYVVMLRM
jgi:hypothetical protein